MRRTANDTLEVRASPACARAPLAPDFVRSSSGMEPVQRVLPGVLIELIRRQPLSPDKVSFAWRTAAGPATARASAVRLEPDGTLIVTVSDARWRREIQRSLSLLRARLDTLLGESLRAVVVRGNEEPR
jgi:Dna[CI] antecedent, DciA